MKDDLEKTNARTGVPPLSRAARIPDGPDRANALANGTLLNEFEIVDLIGEGGFGIVYLAHDRSLKRNVALKEYMPSTMASRSRTCGVTVRSKQYQNYFAAGLRSFINEARLLAQFDSPSLVKVYRFWEANGTAYMVMPYYEGITLKQSLAEGRIVPTEDWIKSMLARLLDTVEMLHRAQCFHRDIAPDNILLLKDGAPLLLDFGSARRVIGDLTQCLTAIVKPGYAPIEQYANVAGLKQGPWTDVYAVAAVVYYLIAGKPPPAVARVVHDDMVPAREAGKGRYSASFLEGLDKALMVRPEQRIQSVDELRKALRIPDLAHRSAHAAAHSHMPQNRMRDVFPGADAEPTMAEQPAPVDPMDEETALAEEPFDWFKPVQPEVAAGAGPKSGKRAMLAMAALLAMGIGGAGVWGLMHTREDAPQDMVQETGQETAQTAAGQSGPVMFDSGAASPVPETKPAVVTARIPDAPPAAPAVRAAHSTPASAVIAAPAAAPARVGAAAAVPAAEARPDVARPDPAQARAALEAIAPDRRQAETEPANPPGAASVSTERELWNRALAWDTPGSYEAYLGKYPKGRYAAAARTRLAEKQAAERPQSQAKEVKEANKSAEKPQAAQKSRAAAAKPAESAQDDEAAVPETPGAFADAAAPKAAASGDKQEAGSRPDAGAQAAKEKPPVSEDRAAVAQDKPAKPAKPDPAPAKAQAGETNGARAPEASAGARNTFRLKGQTMTGDFTVDPVNGLVSGTGRIVWANGDQFEGTLVKGVKEGKGKFSWSNGQRYSGDWMEDTPNGKGVLSYANGNRYEGDVRNGLPHGQGTASFKGGETYSGTWVNGKKHGQGRYTWANGSYFQGEFKDGERTGNGELVVKNGGADTAGEGERQYAGNEERREGGAGAGAAGSGN